MKTRRDIKFVEKRIPGNFTEIGAKYGIDAMTARVIRNRGVEEPDMQSYIYGNVADLNDPKLLKDADLGAELIAEHIREHKKICIIGDYDVDGVMSTFILVDGIRRLGGNVIYQIPHRISDGYGLNMKLVEHAHEEQVDLIVTCDNGISAGEEIKAAKNLGMKVVVTDHHQITNGIPEADAVINPHQSDCSYPYPDICGAVVAWKVLILVYRSFGVADEEVINRYVENAAFATVGDIMPLKKENRTLVKLGLKAIGRTSNLGMRALIAQCHLDDHEIKAYHFGFVLGPCINATGRLDTAQNALELFLTDDYAKAEAIASELVTMNETRKEMTDKGVEAAVAAYEAGGYEKDPVIVLYLPQVHESIAGIIAGRIREIYYKPTFILTKGENGAKGSARSIDEYCLSDEMTRCKELFLKFGGHPKAAGLSLEESKIDEFRARINELCPITVADEVETMYLDACPPVSYLTVERVEQLEVMEPFGNENRGPLFGAKGLRIHRMMRMGKNQQFVKLELIDEQGLHMDGIHFGDAETFCDFIRQKYGESELQAIMAGQANQIRINLVYVPSINDYKGKHVQLEIKHYF